MDGHMNSMLRLGIVAVALATAVAPARAGERLNPAIARLEAGEAALGIFSGNRDMMNARVLGGAKLDFVIIDMEHAPWDADTLRRFVAAMKGTSGFTVAPLVRVAANGREIHHNQWMVKQALDAGAFGIVVPHVNTPEHARAAAVAMRYPPPAGSPAPEPRGERGWGPLIAAGSWGVESGEYARIADLWPLNPAGELLLVVQVESKEAVANLEEILKVPGIGAAFIGPADLHADMGYVGRSGVPEVEAEIQRALGLARAAGVPIGITTGADTVSERLAQGFTFVTIGFDLQLGAGVESALEAVGR
jgi:4-hydroxy-2-oxoheptanedioate aldolase